jgi:hypothetical protein
MLKRVIFNTFAADAILMGPLPLPITSILSWPMQFSVGPCNTKSWQWRQTHQLVVAVNVFKEGNR